MPSGMYERQCTTCKHPELARIEFKLAIGGSRTAIAKEFGLSHDSVSRHWRYHVDPMKKVDLLASRATLRNLVERSRAEDMSLLDFIALIRSQLLRLFLDATKAGKAAAATMVACRLQNLLELQAKVSGELREHAAGQGVHVNIMNGTVQTTTADDEVARVQACVIRALRAHRKPAPTSSRRWMPWRRRARHRRLLPPGTAWPPSRCL